ncbi:uncharacterized protein LOC129988879 isoform X2 [Argiope bruennichi]|uniref:uncharacterized protein LOC129988879 isoform X2 n=1 Tax=Argiope bruennichi TaxID=94029 RepID=UPI002493E647|nr:uncharacterized protein LOC129988879 isoform X2 [Argiope bruennichi]
MNLGQDNDSSACYEKDLSMVLDQNATTVDHGSRPITFSDKDNILVDLQRTSDEASKFSMYKTLICSYCSKKFCSVLLLRKHVQRVHKLKLSDNSYSCAYCKKSFRIKSLLRVHCEKIHQEPVQIDTPWIKAFKKWKLDIERREHAFFIALHGMQRGSKCNKCLYHCYSSGYHEVSYHGNTNRMITVSDSLKIGIMCTATMIVSEYVNEVRVKYCLQHYGHRQETTFEQLSSEEQAAINENVSRGIPLQEQLDDIKHPQSSAEYFQAHMIKKRDIQYINNACTSEIFNAEMNFIEYVEQWVHACPQIENSPVLLYRQEGNGTETENLMLIIMTELQKHILITSTKEVVCIDSQYIKKSKNFVTALVVMDEQDVAFPVAFCISSKLNKSSILEFLSCVRESTGQLSYSYFMSNDDTFFYEAWQEVMQDKSRHIWSIWSVDDKIQKHLSQLLNHIPTRETIYRVFRMMMECNNQEVFTTMLKNFSNFLSDNLLCSDFGKIFGLHYGSNKEMWGCCYRNNLKFSTNFYLEHLHKTLQHCFKRGWNKQLDKFLMMLMKYVRFKMIDRLSNMVDEEKINLAKKAIIMCHNMSLDIKSENITSLSAYKVWLIRSETEADAYVTREYKSCPEICDLRCHDCDVCVHMYSCTCAHSMINANMCKHIHAVEWKFFTPRFSPPTSPTPDPCSEVDNISDNDHINPDKSPDLLQHVMKRMQDVYKQVQMKKYQLNKNALSEVLILLDRCYHICSEDDLLSKPTQTEGEPVISSIHTLKGLVNVASSSNSENIAPIPVIPTNSGLNFVPKTALNSSKIHKKSNFVPARSSFPNFHPVKKIVLNSKGNANSTSKIVVPSNPMLSSVSNSPERKKQVATTISSILSNPVLKDLENTASSEQRKEVVPPPYHVPSSITNNSSSSERLQKRAFIQISPKPDSFSKSRPIAKKKCMKSIHFPDVPSSLKTLPSPSTVETTVVPSSDLPLSSVNIATNSILQMPSIVKSTSTSFSVPNNNANHSQMSFKVKPAILSILPLTNSSNLATNSFDKLSSDEKLNSEIVLSPSSSENQIKFDAPCVIASYRSLKDLSAHAIEVDSYESDTQFKPPSIYEKKSKFLLEHVSKKCDVIKTTVSSSDQLSCKSNNKVSNSFLCIPKSEHSSEMELSFLPSSSSLSQAYKQNSDSHSPVLVNTSQPSISSSITFSKSVLNSADVIDSTKVRNFIKTEPSDRDTNTKILEKSFRRRDYCALCNSSGRTLFSFPTDETRRKKWLAALKWDIPPEKMQSVLKSSRLCDQHFSESSFTSTLKRRLIKFACPFAVEDNHLSPTSDDNLSSQQNLAVSQCTSTSTPTVNDA